VIRLITHFFEPQFPTREQRPKLTEGGGAWRQLAQAIAKQDREELARDEISKASS
jgi:hypothetical protein